MIGPSAPGKWPDSLDEEKEPTTYDFAPSILPGGTNEWIWYLSRQVAVLEARVKALEEAQHNEH